MKHHINAALNRKKLERSITFNTGLYIVDEEDKDNERLIFRRQ